MENDKFNDYFFEAAIFIGRTTKIVKPRMDDSSAIIALLLASIGIEKILKGILFDVDHSSIYIDESHRKTISFTGAIHKCKPLSTIVSQHLSQLLELAKIRNEIAHGVSKDINREFSRQFLLQRLTPLIDELCTERGLHKDTFFYDLPWRLSLYFDEKEIPYKSTEESLGEKMTRHRQIWELKIEDMRHVLDATEFTRKLSTEPLKKIIMCPACSNESVLSVNADYDYADGRAWLAGFYVEKLNCYFCNLFVNEAEEMDLLRLNDHLIPEELKRLK